MDLGLSADQEALRDGVRRLCQGRFPLEAVRALEAAGGMEPSSWAALAEAGVFALRRPEPEGVGLGMADAVVVFEELGRALVPGPLVATHLAAGVAEGDVAGVVERSGPPVVLEHLGSLDVLIVLDDEGVWAVDPREVSAEPVPRPLDPLTPVHVAPSLPQGRMVLPSADAERWRREGAVLTAALQVGLASATTEMAVSYAKERRQFDRPIGSFQAVKHMLADMLVRTEVARAAVLVAAVTLDDPASGHVERAAAGAKRTAGQFAILNGKACVQVHGGMGYTWEVDAHRYLKRAWVLDTVFGSADDHADDLAALL